MAAERSAKKPRTDVSDISSITIWVSETSQRLLEFKKQLDAGAPLRPFILPNLEGDRNSVKAYFASLPHPGDGFRDFMKDSNLKDGFWCDADWYTQEGFEDHYGKQEGANMFVVFADAPWLFLHKVRPRYQTMLNANCMIS